MLVVAVLAISAPAFADDTPPGSIIFARGAQLLRTDAKGKGETEIATLDAGHHVRALRTDAAGKVLLANIDGSWAWMPLDGSAKTLAPLPCDDVPAQLEDDGSHVVCRTKHGAVDIDLATGKPWPVDVPVARIVGSGPTRKFVWLAGDGIWAAPPSASPRSKAQKLAPEPPLRGFIPSPDGTRGIGVYASEVYTDVHHKQPAEVLMGFALDGIAARRKAIKNGVAVEWSHDSQWVLVQDDANACLMHATGGEYKCWRGYFAASISSDGKLGLVLGGAVAPAHKQKPPEIGEFEGDDNEPDDTAILMPSGPLSLYRVKLEGSAFTETPALVTKHVDGAAVWVPAP
ncbi:MAG TPA: hypothetical protein VH143_10515 [Kofleriaceae bacterium]|jgi:hypothetical protein|nr:hypothetical protein [Kofleriaceae bacterium]